ncbi:MAG: SNF2 helicase-associated domain-containing protein [Streptosporangiaceae bacterium]
MLVLHGFWLAEWGMCLWAEDSERRVKSPSQALRSARPHPFAVSADTLVSIYPGKSREVTLLLPSRRTAPVDSPELVRSTPRPSAQSLPALLGWTVPVVCLEPAAALAALAADGADVRHGQSVVYLRHLADFAAELVSRGRVRPALARDGDGATASWRPVLSGPDAVALHGLVRAMPPVCRAVPGRDNPHDLAAGALSAMVDAIARSRLSAGPRLGPALRGRRPARPTATQAWIEALSAPDGRFDADAVELESLAQELRSWEDFGTGQTGPARAMFRLTEVPGEGAGGEGAGGEGAGGPELARSRWLVEFLLQSAADPSLLVTAAQVWSDDGSLSRWLSRPRELLLGELGRASRIYPELADGLRQAQPCGLSLDADGAYGFLTAAAPALDEAGFGVMLPSWWDRRRQLGLTASAKTPVDGVVKKASKSGREQIMEFRWRLAVGDDTLTDDEIAALAETKAPLIRLRGQWVAVDPEQLKRGIEFLSRQPGNRKSVAEILRLAASHPDDIDTPLPVPA